MLCGGSSAAVEGSIDAAKNRGILVKTCSYRCIFNSKTTPNTKPNLDVDVKELVSRCYRPVEVDLRL